MDMIEYGLVLCTDDQDVVDKYAKELMHLLGTQGCSVTRGIGYWRGQRETTHTIVVLKQRCVNSTDEWQLHTAATSYRDAHKQECVMIFVRDIGTNRARVDWV